MTGLEIPGFGWTAGFFTLAVISALVPWVNAELLMLTATAFVGSPVRVALLVALVTIGQMTGKSAMYWISRRAARPRAPRLQYAIDRWQMRFQQHPRSVLSVLLVSSTVGLPPFYLVAVAAGALKVGFGSFLAVGTVGRLVHFALVAFVPHLLWRNL